MTLELQAAKPDIANIEKILIKFTLTLVEYKNKLLKFMYIL